MDRQGCNKITPKADQVNAVKTREHDEEDFAFCRDEVRAEINKLKDADAEALSALNADSVRRRIDWFQNNLSSFDFIGDDPVESAYRLLLCRFGITEKEAPIQKRSDTEIVFHSMNFCPTLEACKILGLDTREVCKKLNEDATDKLVKQVDPRLKFSRNYEKLRPYAPYCEERISFEE